MTQNAILNLNSVTRQPNQTFDEILAIHRVTKDHDIAALWLAFKDAARNGAFEERAGISRIAIGHLIDEQKITDQQCVFHRTGRNPERLEKQRPEYTRNDQGPKNCFDRLDYACHQFRALLHFGWVHIVCFGATCARQSRLSSNWTRLNDYEGLRPRVIIRQGYVDDSLVIVWCHLIKAFFRPAGDMHDRLARS